MRVSDLNEASYDSAEHISGAIDKTVKYAQAAVSKFKSGYKEARTDKQLDARDVMTKTETAQKRAAAKEAAKKKAASQAQAGDGAPAIISSIIIGKFNPTDKDVDTFDFFDVQDLATFRKSYSSIVKRFNDFPDIVKSALTKSDMVNAKNKKATVDEWLTVPPKNQKAVEAIVSAQGFTAADTAFWEGVLGEDDPIEVGKDALKYVKDRADANRAANEADKRNPAGKKVFRAEGSGNFVRMMAYWRILSDRLSILNDLLDQAEKRPRKNPAEEEEEMQEAITRIKPLLKTLHD